MKRIVLSALCAAVLVAAAPVSAQKLSLAERVAALEQKSAAASQGSSQANVDLLNKLTQLQGEMQALRNQVEQLQNENEQLKQRSREQYLDLDSRLQRIEGGAAVSSAPRTSAPAASNPPAAASAVPARNPAPAAAAANPADEAAAYGAAFDQLKRGDYVESARGFRAFLETYPQASLAPNAWYWLGESYYVTQNYDVALESFERLLQQFPGSGKAADALLKKGYCLLELNRADEGRRALDDVINNYPDSDVARLAQSRLRALSLEAR